MQFEDYKKKLDEMAKNLEFLNDMNADIFKNLPIEHHDKFAQTQADTKSAIEAMKNGDTTILNNLYKSYANKNN